MSGKNQEIIYFTACRLETRLVLWEKSFHWKPALKRYKRLPKSMLKLRDCKSLNIPRHHILERDLKIVENLAVEEDIVAHLEGVGAQMIMDKGVGGMEIQVNLSLLSLYFVGCVVKTLGLTQNIKCTSPRAENWNPLYEPAWAQCSTGRRIDV